MNITDTRYMKIRFNDGSERSFAFEPLSDRVDASVLLSHVHKALDSRRLVLRMGETVTIVPFDSIQSIEVSPIPSGMLPDAITVLHEFEN